MDKCETCAALAMLLCSALDIRRTEYYADSNPPAELEDEAANNHVPGAELVGEFGTWRETTEAELVRRFGPWSAQDQATAEAEGWALFECDGGSWGGRYMLEADSDSDAFTGENCNELALEHVRRLARAGSMLHVRALLLDGTQVPA